MNSGNDDQRWRGSNNQQRGGQGGQRRNMPRDGSSYSGGQGGYNNNSNGNSNAWGRGNMNQNNYHNQQQQSPANSNAGYYEQHVPVNGFNPQEALELLTRAYDLHVQAARAPGAEADKPIIYKGDKGWSTPKGNNNAWGQKRNAMASGGDFLVQLKKSHAAFQQSVGRD